MNDDIQIEELPHRHEGALFAESLKDTHIVFAVERAKGTKHLVYGTSFIEAIAEGVIPSQMTSVRAFAVDFSRSCDDLEFLCAAVQVAKGSHEYR
ncbi:MAG: hypothetical protein Q8N18_25135 [Opitutaceae bacterium]|nr:hypothetical protein [Opitutaceae bacterium]